MVNHLLLAIRLRQIQILIQRVYMHWAQTVRCQNVFTEGCSVWRHKLEMLVSKHFLHWVNLLELSSTICESGEHLHGLVSLKPSRPTSSTGPCSLHQTMTAGLDTTDADLSGDIWEKKKWSMNYNIKVASTETCKIGLSNISSLIKPQQLVSHHRE